MLNHPLCHFHSKVLVRNGVVPRHVLANHRIEENLADVRDLLQGGIIGQINGNKGEEEVNKGHYRVETEKCSRVLH